MKREFLNSLIGLTEEEAKEKIDLSKWTVDVVPEYMYIPLITRPKTIILWMDKHNKIMSVTLGDPYEYQD